jgi:flavin reductase (DIM6/NTAB) family NADH-FMN oxidoreductase RutF
VPAPSPGIVGPVPAGRDPEAYDRLRRRVLWSLPTGLFVVGSRSGSERNLMTCNWVMQVATSPKLVVVAVEDASVTRRLIETGGGFTVSVLPRTARGVVRRFVKPTQTIELDGDGRAVEMQGEAVVETDLGSPRLAVARAWLSCALRQVVRWDAEAKVGDGADDGADGSGPSHVLAVGEVVDVGEADVGKEEGEEGAGGVLRMEDTRMNYGG